MGIYFYFRYSPFLYLLPYRNMETALFHLIFYIAALVYAHVSKYLAKNPFQRVVSHGTTRGAIWVANGRVAVVAEVKRRSV